MAALEHDVDENAFSRESDELFNLKHVQIHRFFKNLDLYRCDVSANMQHLSVILPVTKSFQLRTVQWMINRETHNILLKSDGSLFTGGILTDTVDMGKITEILCCILENPAFPEFYHRQQIAVEDWKGDSGFTPESSLVLSTSNYVWAPDSSGTNYSVFGGTVLQRTIDDTVNENAFGCASRETLSPNVMCVICGKIECRVRFRGKRFQNNIYFCNDCVKKSENNSLHCKATLIVVLHSTLTQWTDEIKRLANLGLKTFVYCGVLNCDCHVGPVCFNDYDIIITGYSHQWNCNNILTTDSEMELQNIRNDICFLSPLGFIKWWRICFNNYLEMEYVMFNFTLSLQCVHKWVTGEQTSFIDYLRIINILDLDPFYDYTSPLWPIIDDKSFLYSWLSNVIRHNLIDDLNIELKVPKLTNIQHWLTYSSPNGLSYLDKHNKPCHLVNAQLKNVNWKKLNPIMQPIKNILKKCVNLRCKIGILNELRQGSMVDILNDNLSLWYSSIAQTLSSIFLLHNIVATHVDMSPCDAVQYYNTVVNISKKYKNKVYNVDTFQVIHAIDKIFELFIKYPDTFSSAQFQYMKMGLEQLKNEYEQCDTMNEYIRTMMDHYSDKIPITNNKTLVADWYKDMFELTDVPRHFFYELKLNLSNCSFGVTDISDRLETRDDVLKILQEWLESLGCRRTRVLKSFAKIQKLSFKEFYNSTYMCCSSFHNIYKSHTDVFENTRREQLCNLCKSETYLKEYEEMLYNFSHNNISVNTYEKSQKELLLKMLFNYGKNKIKDEKWLKNATIHIEMFSLLHTEFNDMHSLWCKLNDAKSQYHYLKEYDIKSYYKRDIKEENVLAYTYHLVELKFRVYGKRTINEINNVKENYKLDQLLLFIKKQLSILNHQISTSTYIESLKIRNSANNINNCFICLKDRKYKWVILLCGHIMCEDCIEKLCNVSNTVIKCPLCGCCFQTDDSYIKYIDNKELNVNYTGNFSIKIKSVTLKLMELIAINPNVKVLIFSFWCESLNLLAEALRLNSVNYEFLKPHINFEKTIKNFKTNPKTNALLMKLSSAFKDFSVIEATGIFFMEPIINKTFEIQAISKIHRIGQTQPTFVHHFIIQDTIEEKITNLFANKSLNNWDEVTVTELAEILYK